MDASSSGVQQLHYGTSMPLGPVHPSSPESHKNEKAAAILKDHRPWFLYLPP
jgi:hypothetical protein